MDGVEWSRSMASVWGLNRGAGGSSRAWKSLDCTHMGMRAWLFCSLRYSVPSTVSGPVFIEQMKKKRMAALSVGAWLLQEFLFKTRQRRPAVGRKQRPSGKQTGLSGCKALANVQAARYWILAGSLGRQRDSGLWMMETTEGTGEGLVD